MSWEKKLARISPHVAKLKAGEVKVIDGTVIGIEHKMPLITPLLAGLPEATSKTLAPVFAELETPKLEEAKFVTANKKIIGTIADHYSGHLPAAKKTQLKNLYLGAFDKAFKVQKQVVEDKIKLQAAHKNLAQIMSDMVLDELKIFAGQQKAQQSRYRKWRGNHVLVNDQVHELVQKAYSDLIDGKYLKTESKAIQKEQALLEKPESAKAIAIMDKAKFYTPTMSNYMEMSVAQLLVEITSAPGQYEYQEEVYSTTPLGWSTKIYSAEHSILTDVAEAALTAATGLDWSSILGDIGLVHVSIVGGVWKQYKQHILIKKVRKDTGAVVKEEKVTRYHADFNRWLVANGCASWLKSDDDLILLDHRYFSTYEYAKRYLRGQTPTPKGKYYPVRACAYSVGVWGINWLCHQNANAFTGRKYGWKRIGYPSNYIYGTSGNFYLPIYGPCPISKRKCPIPGCYPHRGGVPGSFLYYNVAPWYGSGALGAGLDIFMDGGGYGLDERWNGKKQEWQASHADYTTRSIPFTGPSWQSTYSGWE